MHLNLFTRRRSSVVGFYVSLGMLVTRMWRHHMRLYSRTKVFNLCTCSYLLVFVVFVVFSFDAVTRPLKTLEPLLPTVVLYTSEDCDCVNGVWWLQMMICATYLPVYDRSQRNRRDPRHCRVSTACKQDRYFCTHYNACSTAARQIDQ